MVVFPCYEKILPAFVFCHPSPFPIPLTHTINLVQFVKKEVIVEGEKKNYSLATNKRNLPLIFDKLSIKFQLSCLLRLVDEFLCPSFHVLVYVCDSLGQTNVGL